MKYCGQRNWFSMRNSNANHPLFNIQGFLRSRIKDVRDLINAIPLDYKQIFFAFISTRLVLTLVGVIGRIVIKSPDALRYSRFIFFDIWGCKDSGWYVNIALQGYSMQKNFLGQTNLAFFPLYPYLMKFVGFLIGNRPFIAGIIISNIFLLVSLIYLYKLIKLDYEKQIAMKTARYLLLLPVAFIFSGVFTESIFLALTVMSLYYAKKDKWLISGICGFFSSLTKVTGFLLLVPILIILLKKIKYNFSKLEFKHLYTLLIPAGFGLYYIFLYINSGNFFEYFAIQEAWGRDILNPLSIILSGVISSSFTYNFLAGYTIISMILLLSFIKKIKLEYFVYSIYTLFIPLFSSLESIPRYTLVIFPFAFIFALIGRSRNNDMILSISLALIQGGLMLVWAGGIPLQY
ncbi:hypothetical protein GF362_06135 [Candidatus Dojkabacteria bacterium]|nr:hypothetical protein [Candidatus Dojkabacteria bacterium]